MNKRILAFAGRNGCGKETAAKDAADRLGTQERHTYSAILEQTYRLWGYEQNSRDDHQELSTFMRKQKGQDALAQAMLAKCKRAPGGWIVIDGVRRLDDLEALNAEFGHEHITLVWVEASADTRYERLKKRKEKAGEQFKTRDVFDQEEQAESEVQLEVVRAACVGEIDNNGPLEALVEQVDLLCHDLTVGPVAYG